MCIDNVTSTDKDEMSTHTQVQKPLCGSPKLSFHKTTVTGLPGQDRKDSFFCGNHQIQ